MAAAEPPSHAGSAFGLSLQASFALPGVLEPGTRPTGASRPLTLALGPADWPAAQGERTCTLARPSGEVVLTIDRLEPLGYRVWVKDLGHLRIDPDGRHIEVATAPEGTPDRFRLLMGQGLPIAAALQGLEVLHASATVLAGGAAAFTAASGTGKTSLALALVARGAELVADDVVALEARGDGLVAHPGVRVVHQPVAGGKVDVVLPVVHDPAPLRHVCFLERSPSIERIEVLPLPPGDPRHLLAATFVSHVPTRERLITQLDACSRIAQTAQQLHVRCPIDGGADALAAAVEPWLT